MNTEADLDRDSIPQQLVAALAANAQLRRRLTHATTECFRLRQELAKEAARLREDERDHRTLTNGSE